MKKNKTLRILGILIIILLVICVIKFVSWTKESSIYNELVALKLIPQQEHFTELYFEDASALPKETIQGETRSFSFAVHNVEGVTMSYPYRVYFQYPSGHQVIFASDTITLSDNASTSIKVTHTFLSSHQKGIVVVVLPSIHQSIDFLVPNNN